jgi:hypothetical protein
MHYVPLKNELTHSISVIFAPLFIKKTLNNKTQMKKLIFAAAAVVAAFTFTSCGGAGWTDETKKALKENCMMSQEIFYEKSEAEGICDCAVKGLVEKFPKADYSVDQQVAAMENCSKDIKSKLEKEMDKQLEESAADTTAMNEMMEETAEGAMDKVTEEVKDAAKH